MEVDGADNSMKLKRGRISLDRKREILEQYDLLTQPCSDVKAAAILGVSQKSLVKILSERDEIKAVKVKEEPVETVHSEVLSNPKLRKGRLSFEKQREILRLYDELPKCSNGEAANRLGLREVTLVKLLANRRMINSGKRKRKTVQSSSDSDDDDPSEPVDAGPLTLQQKELLRLYDALPKTISRRAAAAELEISEDALSKLLSSRDATARLSQQPGGSGVRNRSLPRGTHMALREGRRVRVDFSEDEQSGSDFEQGDSDLANEDDDAEFEDEDLTAKKPRYKHHTQAERMAILEKYDAMQPCLQSHAAKVLGVTQSSLSNWLKFRNLSNSEESKPKTRKSKQITTNVDSEYSGEEIESFVMTQKGSKTQTQVVQFFDVGAEDSNKSKGSSSNESNSRKHLTLKDKFEIYRKYDAMDSKDRKNAAEIFKVPKSSWLSLLANRYYFEKEFKRKLQKDMEILGKYDEIKNKKAATRVLGLAKYKLDKILENRDETEKYYSELVAPNEDEESVAQSTDEMELTWKDSDELKALEIELLNWFKQTNNEQTMNWNDLKNKAKELAADMGIVDFHPLDSWLKKWNKTHRVFWNKRGKLVEIYGFGENRSVSDFMLMALKDYPPENVFNLVETGLYYRALPGCTPLTDDWVVAAFACNMSGTEKKRALVVGKSEAPLLFRVMPLPLTYKYSRTATMNEGVATEFLENWDRELATEKRKVALVLDSSSSHPNLQLSHIRLFFVPDNCARDQPLSDVVAQVKSTYRNRMAESLQNMSGSSSESVTIVDALFALAEAWDKTPKSLLVSKFLNTTFPQNNTARTELETKELEILNKLDDKIQLHSSADGVSGSGDGGLKELNGGRVVHVEGTLHLSDENEEDFDIDSLLRDKDTTDQDAPGSPKSTPDLGSKLKNFLSKPTPNGTAKTSPKGCRPPSASAVKDALSTIKRFLHHNGGTLEDLTDYTQLEIKVLSKMKDIEAQFKHS